MNSLKKNNCKGFTLVEILIAILIFSIIIFTLFSSFKAFIVSSESIKKNVAHSEKIRTVNKRISMDLESIFLVQQPRYKKPSFDSNPDLYRIVGKEETVGQNLVSSLTFTSYAHTKSGSDQRDGVARISYYLREKGDNLYDLYRADSLPPFPDELQSCSDPILCKNISGFVIVYKDFIGDEYRSWDSEASEFKYTFPAGIDFKMIFGTGDEAREVVMSVRLVTGRLPIE